MMITTEIVAESERRIKETYKSVEVSGNATEVVSSRSRTGQNPASATCLRSITCPFALSCCGQRFLVHSQRL